MVALKGSLLSCLKGRVTRSQGKGMPIAEGLFLKAEGAPLRISSTAWKCKHGHLEGLNLIRHRQR